MGTPYGDHANKVEKSKNNYLNKGYKRKEE
jgi:hypothetical protein